MVSSRLSCVSCLLAVQPCFPSLVQDIQIKERHLFVLHLLKISISEMWQCSYVHIGNFLLDLYQIGFIVVSFMVSV